MTHALANIAFEIALVVAIAAAAGTVIAYRRRIRRALRGDDRSD